MNQSSLPFKSDQTIAWVEAGWHADIVGQSRLGFTEKLARYGVDTDRIECFEVPGSLEIPLKCKRLANTGRHPIIVAAGLIVDGGIYRHEFVASAVLDGMMRVQLDTGVPILSVVLTPHHFSGDESHIEYFSGHFRLKGAEAAEACFAMLQ